jgi:hypothetical protein
LTIVSVAVGVGSVFGLMVVLNTFYNAGVTVQEYGLLYSVLTGLPIALAAAVWLDYFLGTNFLPD